MPNQELTKAISLYAGCVKEFQDRWGVGRSGIHDGSSYVDVLRARMHLLYDGIDELSEAMDDTDRDDVLDELCKVLFVMIGTVDAVGVDVIDAMRRVAEANDRKTCDTHRLDESSLKVVPKNI